MKGNSKHLKQAEVWTWDEASRVFEGIKLLLKAIRTGRTAERLYSVFYPTRSLKPKHRIIPSATPGDPQRGYDDRAPPRHDSPCDGCRNRRAIDDWTHSRIIGQCGYPHHPPYFYGKISI